MTIYEMFEIIYFKISYPIIYWNKHDTKEHFFSIHSYSRYLFESTKPKKKKKNWRLDWFERQQILTAEISFFFFIPIELVSISISCDNSSGPVLI